MMQVRDRARLTNILNSSKARRILKLQRELHTKIGRQTIALDDVQLFGISDWAQGERSHDALSVYYNLNRFNATSYLPITKTIRNSMAIT